jgi:hypothetical protein
MADARAGQESLTAGSWRPTISEVHGLALHGQAVRSIIVFSAQFSVVSIQSSVQDETLQTQFIAENEEALSEGEKILCGRECGPFSGGGNIASRALPFPLNTEN